MLATGKVNFPPVTVHLHWPSAGCPQCAGECEKIAHEMYQCESCGWVNHGYNKALVAHVKSV